MGKINAKGGLAKLMSATATTQDRFAAAAAVMGANPSGLAVGPSAPVQPAVAASLQPVDKPQAAAETDNDTVWAPIENVADNPYNARQVYDQAIINERAESIAINGQMTPAPACVDPDRPGHYILIGGHYRKRGALRANKTHLQLKLLKVTSKLDMYRLSFLENDQRASGTPIDNALSWKKLLDDGVASTHEDICTATGQSRPVIVKTLAILNLPKSVMDLVMEHPARFTLTAAYDLSRIASASEKAAIEAAQKLISEEGMSTRELASLLERLDRPVRKKKETSRQHKILVDGKELGAIKDWDSGRVTLDITLENPAERTKLVAELRQRFGLSS